MSGEAAWGGRTLEAGGALRGELAGPSRYSEPGRLGPGGTQSCRRDALDSAKHPTWPLLDDTGDLESAEQSQYLADRPVEPGGKLIGVK